jgi:hypothetical protein
VKIGRLKQNQAYYVLTWRGEDGEILTWEIPAKGEGLWGKGRCSVSLDESEEVNP